MKKTNFRFKKICKRCDKSFKPIGKQSKICEKCCKPKGNRKQSKQIKTIITCPNCETQIDCKDIKYEIHSRINKAITEVNKTI